MICCVFKIFSFSGRDEMCIRDRKCTAAWLLHIHCIFLPETRQDNGLPEPVWCECLQEMLQNDEVQTGRYSPPLSPRCHTVSSIQSLPLYKAFVLLPPKRLLPLSGFLQSAPHTCSGTPGCCPSKHPHEVPPMPPLEEMYSKASLILSLIHIYRNIILK